jgi:2,3-bisphosphoglycerate-independent phosphoglycerate mutase
VTFFFNGGLEKPFDLEDRLMVPSPKVPTYDLQPEMSADGVGKAVSQQMSEREREIDKCSLFPRWLKLSRVGNIHS